MQKIRSTGNGNGNKSIICPEGTHNAVLNEIYDLGLQSGLEEGENNYKHVYVFHIDKLIEGGSFDGERYAVSMIVNDSASNKGNLYSMVRPLYGRDLTYKEMQELDLDSLLGLPCIVDVVHKQKKDGKVSAYIKSVSRHMPALPKLERKPGKSTAKWIEDIQNRRLDKTQYTAVAVEVLPTTTTTTTTPVPEGEEGVANI